MKISRIALRDIDQIYRWNFHFWSEAQADKYQEFLIGIFESIESGSKTGRVIDQTDIYSYLAKYRSAKHGHRIVYRFTDGEIVVIRIIHTAMDFPDSFPD